MWEAKKEIVKVSLPTEHVSENNLVLETQLAEIIGKLSNPSSKENQQELEKEYQKVLRKLKK